MIRFLNVAFGSVPAILAGLVFLLVAFRATAQVSQKEHLEHHPGQAGGSQKKGSAPQGEPGKGGGMMGGGEEGGMMGGGMGKMMEKMGAPKERELYPELMQLPDLPAEKRAEVLLKAEKRMSEGTQLIAAGVGELADAASADKLLAMQAATERIREGVAQLESGLAARRALAEGSDPRNVALQWFRKEMNLAGGGGFTDDRHGVFGMSTFHFVSMAALIVFAVLMLWMYFFKMRRASQLLAQLAAEAKGAPPIAKSGPAVGVAVTGEPGLDPSPSDPAQVELAPEPSKPPEFPSMRSRTEPVQKWSGKLRVCRILSEVPGVKTFRLAATDGVALPFTYYPGQFLTLSLDIDGKPVKRSYTIASTPTQLHYAAITVKREEQGFVSRFLHDRVEEGDLLELVAANGKLTFTGDEADSIVLIGGGVGITPLMSVIRYLTDIGWHNDIFLLYCCRTTSDFIFRSELEQLQLMHPNLHIHASMTREPDAVWMGLKGRFTASIIRHLVPEIEVSRIHICGPPPMMNAMRDILRELKVPDDQVLTEAFGPAKKSPKPVDATAAAVDPTAATTVEFKRSEKSAPLTIDQTVLDAADAVGVDIDNSCRTGQCGLCKVKLLSGDVTMECDDALSDGDKEGGLVLACQAKATAPIAIDA